jgi:hypothetical protein
LTIQPLNIWFGGIGGIEDKTGIGESDGRQPGIIEQFDGRYGSRVASDQRDADCYYKKYCRLNDSYRLARK